MNFRFLGSGFRSLHRFFCCTGRTPIRPYSARRFRSKPQRGEMSVARRPISESRIKRISRISQIFLAWLYIWPDDANQLAFQMIVCRLQRAMDTHRERCQISVLFANNNTRMILEAAM
jgi:hypothetical protein